MLFCRPLHHCIEVVVELVGVEVGVGVCEVQMIKIYDLRFRIYEWSRCKKFTIGAMSI